MVNKINIHKIHNAIYQIKHMIATLEAEQNYIKNMLKNINGQIERSCVKIKISN